MNEVTLQQKLTTLTNYPHLSAETVTRFGEILRSLGDWDLRQLNPLTFADYYGFERSELIDLCIHGVKVGLFDFVWNMICPHCGGVEYSFGSVNDFTGSHFLCTLCRVNAPSNLDDQVEVAFVINPSIKKLQINPFADVESYLRYFFSANLVRSEPHQAYFIQSIRYFQSIQPDAEIEMSFELTDSHLLRLITLTLHHTVIFLPSGAPTQEPQFVTVDLLPTGFSTTSVSLSPGPVIVKVRNLRFSPVDIMLSELDLAEMHDIVRKYPATWLPMFTGKMLLNTQSFRDLFQMQNLKADLKLNIRSLTLLFTDLKGSTDLYDSTGDAFAYNLIQEHFQILSEAVHHNSGAIVKTMGDAVMATFSSPREGIQAATEMMQGIQAFNHRIKSDGHALGLKIGVHEGAALVVNANDRLDYFGQTVNVAARVQGLAKADEIWVTQPVFQSDQVNQILQQAGYQSEEHSVALKGVSQAATVYRLHQI